MLEFHPSGNVVSMGSIIMDMVVNCDRFPKIGETLYTPYEYKVVPGGKGSNQAVAAGRLGANIRMLGRIADDDYAQIMVNSLRQANVNTEALIVEKNAKTGVAFVWVDKEGRNQIICSPAVHSKFSLADLEKEKQYIREGDVFLTTLEYEEEIIYEAVKNAKEKGCLVIVDPSASDYGKLTERVSKYIDILKPNEIETEFLTGMKVEDTETAALAITKLKERGIKTPLVSLGARGIVYEDEGEIVHIKGLDVKPIDTTAAGDTFIGGVASRLSQGARLKEAVEFGNKAAAKCVQIMGAQPSIPFLKDLK